MPGGTSGPYHHEVHSCEVCNAKVHELRRGRCWGCYARWVATRPVGEGARCVTCSEKRRRFMKAVELFGSWKPMCFNCAGQLLHLDPLPATLAAMRELVSRERRKLDRRFGKPDTRVFQYDRRTGDRRVPGDEYVTIDDDMIIEVTLDVDEATLTGRDRRMDLEDVTRIRELVPDLHQLEHAR